MYKPVRGSCMMDLDGDEGKSIFLPDFKSNLLPSRQNHIDALYELNGDPECQPFSRLGLDIVPSSHHCGLKVSRGESYRRLSNGTGWNCSASWVQRSSPGKRTLHMQEETGQEMGAGVCLQILRNGR